MDPGTGWREILTTLGIDPGNAMAGFSGGVVRVLQMKITSAITVLATAVSGTLIAIYLGDIVSKTTSVPVTAASFLIGYGGVQVIEYVFNQIRQRLAPDGGQHEPH
jgi:hypothetical protein